MAWALIVLYLVAVTPLRAGVILHIGGGQGISGAAGVIIWGVRIGLKIGLIRNAAGKRQLFIGRRMPLPGEAPAPAPAPGAGEILGWLRAVKRANRGRTLVKNAVSLDDLQLDALVPGFGAASAAVFTGLLQAAGGLIPGLRVRARPAYQGVGAARVRCMISCRLGMLLAACALGTVSYLMERKKEEKPWIIPSEA